MAEFENLMNTQANSVQERRESDPMVFNMSAKAFFGRYGKPAGKATHQFFTDNSGKPLQGFAWKRAFTGMVNTVYIGKTFVDEGIDLKKLAQILETGDPRYEIHVRKGADEGYIARVRHNITTEGIDDYFSSDDAGDATDEL